MRVRPRDETGAAVVTGLLWIGVLLAIGVACVLAVAVITQHRQSQAAADLAALAGAQAHQQGEDGCAAAHALARRNRATVLSCQLIDADVLVTVGIKLPSVLEAVGELRARARAGPVDP